LEGNWNTPAGQALEALAKAISARGLLLSAPIVVFGSGPLQIFVDQHLLSKDVDVSAGKQMDEVKRIVDEIGYGKNKAAFYIEVVPLYIFRPGQNWGARARNIELHGVKFLIPQTIDILLGKLRRLEEKDIKAFEAVRQKLNHPTEEELITELRDSWDAFAMGRDGTKPDLWKNTEVLWKRLFGKEIDVRKVILEPVLQEMGEALNTPDYIEEMRQRFGV
jgi:hypothetical protein